MHTLQIARQQHIKILIQWQAQATLKMWFLLLLMY